MNNDIFEKVLKARTKAGIKDVEGDKAKSITSDTNKKEYGNKVQTELIGSPTKGSYIQFTPAIDTFLKEKIDVDTIIGVSAGALFGMNYKSKQIGRVGSMRRISFTTSEITRYFSLARSKSLSLS